MFGVECSDGVLRCMSVSNVHGDKKCFLPLQYGEVAMLRGSLEDGAIADKAMVTHSLKVLKKQYGITRVRFALPSSVTYCFTVSVSKKTKNIQKAVESVIGEYVPLAKNDAVINCDVVHSHEDMNIVRVVAVDKKIVQQYSDAFVAAGIIPIHFESEVQAVSSAVLPAGLVGVTVMVMVHADHTVIALVYNTVVVYSKVLNKGGNNFIADVATLCVIAPNEAYVMVSEYGFSAPTEYQTVFGVLADSVSEIVHAIKSVTTEWNTQKVRKNIFPAIDTVLLVGEYSTIPGFSEYITSQLGILTSVANPWERCIPCADTVPVLPYQDAVRYSTAIGLAVESHIHE